LAILERHGQHAQGFDIAGIGFEADLQLAQGPLGVAPLQVDIGQLLHQGDIGAVVVDQALGNLDVILDPVGALEVLGGPVELLHRLFAHALPGVQLGQLDPAGDVVGIQVDDAPQNVQRLPGHPLLIVVGGHHLKMGHGIADDPQVLIFVRQAQVHIDPGIIYLEYLLEYRDGLEVKALLRVGAGHPQVGVHRLALLSHPDQQIALLQERADVVGILAENLLVLTDGLLDLALLDVLERVVVDLVLVDRHWPPYP
jgi:hypothetical protein